MDTRNDGSVSSSSALSPSDEQKSPEVSIEEIVVSCAPSNLRHIRHISSMVNEMYRTRPIIHKTPADPINGILLSDMWLHTYGLLDTRSLVSMMIACKEFATISNHNTIRSRLYNEKDKRKWKKIDDNINKNIHQIVAPAIHFPNFNQLINVNPQLVAPVINPHIYQLINANPHHMFFQQPQALALPRTVSNPEPEGQGFVMKLS